MVSTIIETFSRRPMFGHIAHGAVAARDRFPGVRPVGPPHVRDRPAAHGQQFLHRRQHDDRAARRRADLLLDRDARHRTSEVRHAAAVRHRLLRHLRARRPDRRDARFRAARPAAARHVFRRGAFPLRVDRRRGVPAVRRVLLLVSEGHRHACWTSGWASGTFWLFFIGFNVTFFPMHIARPGGHAAARLHLSGRHGLGRVELHCPPSAPTSSR